MAESIPATRATTATSTNVPPSSTLPQEDPFLHVPKLVENLSSDGTISNRYQFGSMIGKGAFAQVYLCQQTTTKKKYAIKVVAKSSLVKSKAQLKFRMEVRISQMLIHPHVVRFERFFDDSKYAYMVLELCGNKSMSNLIGTRKLITECEARYYMVQLLSAITYLHQNLVIHRDLKLGNIFLDSQMRVKLGDFGLAAHLTHREQLRKTVCGTPNYVAPEQLEGKVGHSFPVDIWSTGVILFTLLTGKPPYQSKNLRSTYRRILSNTYRFPTNVNVSQEAQSLISQLLQLNPRQRLTLSQISQHRFFTASTSLMPKLMPESALREVPVFASHTMIRLNGNGLAVNRNAVSGVKADVDKTNTRSSDENDPLVINRLSTYGSNSSGEIKSRYDAAANGAESARLMASRIRDGLNVPLASSTAAPSMTSSSRYTASNTYSKMGSNTTNSAYLPESESTSQSRRLSGSSSMSSNSARVSSLHNQPRTAFDVYVDSEMRAPSTSATTSTATTAWENMPPPPVATCMSRPVTAPSAVTTNTVRSTSTYLAAYKASSNSTSTGVSNRRTAWGSPDNSEEVLSSATNSGARLPFQNSSGSTSEQPTSTESASVETSPTSTEYVNRLANALQRGASLNTSPSSTSEAPRPTFTPPPAVVRSGVRLASDVPSGPQQSTLPSGSTNSPSPSEARYSTPPEQILRPATVIARPPNTLETLHNLLTRNNLSFSEPPAVSSSHTASAVPNSYSSSSMNGAVVHEMERPPAATIWVVRYVDYTAKYGLAFLFNTGSAGVYFNDNTKIVASPDGSVFQYIERRKRDDVTGATSGENIVRKFPIDSYPPELQKKVVLLLHFRTYLLVQPTDNNPSNGGAGAITTTVSGSEKMITPPMSVTGTCPAMYSVDNLDIEMPYLKKWVRTKHALLFRISNHTMQVVFYDTSEILLSSAVPVITYVNKAGQRSQHALDEIVLTGRVDIAKRLKYTKDFMHRLINGATR